MWLITVNGFYSIHAAEAAPEDVYIRTPVAEDLDTLRDRYLPRLGPVEESLASDYRFRAQASREERRSPAT